MLTFTNVDGRNIGDVKLYALSTCGWCKKTKAFLNDHNIGYSYVDVDLLPPADKDEARRQQTRHNPAGSFPTIVIDGERSIAGYDVDSLMQMMGE